MAPIFVECREVQADSVQHLDLADIQRAGTIIAGTLSGPDTYYEYRGQEFGLQFRLAQDFARSIGVRLRMETSPDTATLLARLHSREIDFVALEMPRWMTRPASTALSRRLDAWWSPTRRDEVAATTCREQPNTMSRRSPHPSVLNRSAGTLSDYDALFIRYCRQACMDWRLVAAICYQESAFDPQAQSWAGAQGLMQLMPSTSQILGVLPEDVFNPEINIDAGTRLLGQLQHAFSDVVDVRERTRFVLAAYNGGEMHVRDAMALARRDGKDAHRWSVVSAYILRLSDPRYYRDPVVRHGYMRGEETEAYVRSIENRWTTYRSIARSASSPTQPQPSRLHTRDGQHQSQVMSADELLNSGSEP